MTIEEMNKIGIVEGLEIAALYHDAIVEKNKAGAVFDENGPTNGPALAVVAHQRHARNIRALKDRGDDSVKAAIDYANSLPR